MKILTFGIIIFICLCSISIGTVAGYGEDCSVPANCTSVGETCDNTTSKCTCETSNNYIHQGNKCVKELGTACSDTNQCNSDAVLCDTVCKCDTTTHFDDNGADTQGGSCIQKKDLGETCTDASQCSDTNTICSSTCQCKVGYYDTDGTGNIGGQCSAKKDLGETCTDASQCSDTNTICSSTCQCKVGYYDTDGTGNIGGQCNAKKDLGETCTDVSQCSDTNTICSSTCQCKDGYYDTTGTRNIGGQCNAKKELGEAGCSTSVTDSCKDIKSRCSTNGGYCTCLTGYYDSNGNNAGGTCESDKGLGKACTGKPNECADSAAQCTGGKCTCGVNYYDSNGFTEGGNCLSVTNLQVTNVDFPSSSVKTNEITVTWSAPVNYNQYIDRYTVEWKRTHDSSIAVQSEGVASLGTSLTLTRGIESGRAYTVTIISINDQTQTSSERTTSVKKQQAAKPTVTSGLDWSNSDRDATTGTIKVAWVAAAGYISQYYVQLLDETTMINSKIVTSPNTHAEFPSSGLEDGYRYNVKITARSESYDSGRRVSGETFTAEFKTTPKIPDAPQNGVCKDPTDKSITLKWSKPADTKGDLVKYHVYVYQNSNTLKFIVSTAGTGTQKIVGNLDPGTSYTFRIYTENEMYNSSSSNNVTTGCKTKAKMSEAPTNLDISNVTSRSFDISWMKPSETHSAENYGYVLQIKDDQDKCVTEIIYKCSDCTGSFQISVWAGLCNVTVRQVIPKSKVQLEGQFTYPARLNPDISYTVTVTASNDAGRGYPANDTERTLEEAPQVPYNVAVSEIETTSLKVTWSIDEPRPGKTNFTIELMADNPAATKEFTISGFDRREYVAQHLEEYWNYSVTVKAATSVDAKTSEKTQKYTTKPAAPGEVSDFKITEAPGKNYTVMRITWKAPGILERNSIIKTYSFEHYATGKVTTTKNFTQDSLEDYVYTVMLDVKPEETYTISVYAVNVNGQKGENITRKQTAPAGVPINIEDTLGVKIIPENLLKNPEQRKFTISLVPEFFTEQTYGIPQGTGLAGCAKNCDFTGIQILDDFDSMDNWNKASVNGFELWRITNSTFLDVLKKKQGNSRRKRSTTQLDYTVGSDDCSQVQQGEYCNGPLQPGTSYTIVAVSCTSGGCLVSKEYGPFVTLAVPDDDDNLPMIIGIVVAVVVVVVIGAVVGFVLFRKKRSGPGKMKPASESDDDEFTTIDPAVAKIPRKRPIVLEEIEEYVNKMHKDSNLLFSAEYEDLKTLSPKHACEAADREENRMRNRYINIIPFDHTRVKLSTNGEDDSSDYINANYLPGYSSPREYIGCQGPIPGTIDDFWRMTWEQNVSVVVMLTLCKEGQKIKCEQYWPDEVGEPKQYGDVIVEITSYSNIRTYDYRMFKITNGSTTRVVKHFHFLSWLDFQANVHHDIILDFIQHVRQHVQPPDTSGPMIIHCSAGVGRTGTYIALDHLMQFINEHDFAVEIDIFDLVLKLRENRQHMVQTEQQYVFIHDCVKEIMDRKRRQMENIYENQAFLEKLNAAQDENIYQNEQSLYENVSQAKSEQNTEL